MEKRASGKEGNGDGVEGVSSREMGSRHAEQPAAAVAADAWKAGRKVMASARLTTNES